MSSEADECGETSFQRLPRPVVGNAYKASGRHSSPRPPGCYKLGKQSPPASAARTDTHDKLAPSKTVAPTQPTYAGSFPSPNTICCGRLTQVHTKIARIRSRLLSGAWGNAPHHHSQASRYFPRPLSIAYESPYTANRSGGSSSIFPSRKNFRCIVSTRLTSVCASSESITAFRASRNASR